MNKLYLIVRSDLTPGQQIAQTAHAMASFAKENPASFNNWIDTSGYVVCLSVHNELELCRLVRTLELLKVRVFKFREADLRDSLTAIAIDPDFYQGVKPRLRHLPLALST